MIDLLTCRTVQLVAPQLVAAGSVTSFYCDTFNGGAGCDWAKVVIQTGATGASGLTVANVTECETSAGVYTNIAATVSTVDTANAGTIIINDIDYRDKGTHMRYLKVAITAGAEDCYVSAFAIIQPKLSVTDLTTSGTGSLAGSAVAAQAWNVV